MSRYKKYLFEEGPFKKPEFSLEGLDIASFPITDWIDSNEPIDFSKIQDNDPFNDLLFGIDNPEVINGYLKCDVTSTNGTMSAKMWSKKGLNFNEVIDNFRDNKAYKISGKWNEWPKGSGKFSVVIERYIPVKDANTEDLLPRISESRTDLRNELLFYISTMSKDVQQLTIDMLKDVWDDFIIRPAAKGHHHFQLSGLLQHVVELLRVAHPILEMDKVKQEDSLYFIHKLTGRILWTEKQRQRKEEVDSFSAFYEKEEHLLKVIDAFLRCKDVPVRDVVLFAIIFHDIGKILEYTHMGDSAEKFKLWFPGDIPLASEQVGVSMDGHGVRIGHITLGVVLVYKYWLSGKYPLPYTFWLDVIGCIQSHHGRLDWGSTKIPDTANEWLVHFCDFIDSKFANEK